MFVSNLCDKLLRVWRWGLRPGSTAALVFAVGCFLVASGVHLAFRLIRPDLAAYSTYYGAVLFATIVGGVSSGAVVLVLGGLTAWFIFEPTFLTVPPPLSDEFASLLLYCVSSVFIIWVAETYRRVVRRLDAEEHYRRLVVSELNHRIKNKFATVYAVLGHEMRAHGQVWSRIEGRLRALAAADQFLLHADGESAEMMDILAAELSAYGRSRVSYQGESVRLPPKLAAMLALVFHELATNAAKYGALSISTGRVQITWNVSGSLVKMRWEESNGPEVAPPTRRGFGTRLLSHALDPFHGVIESTYSARGLRCDISFAVPKESELTARVPYASMADGSRPSFSSRVVDLTSRR
jgi:two-component sensor histidine kinase